MRTTYRRRRERSACDGRGLRLVAVPVVNGDLLDPGRDRAPARRVRSRQQTGEALTENDTIGCAEAGAELLDQCDDLGGLTRSRSEEHTSELQSPCNLVCRLLLEKNKRAHGCLPATARPNGPAGLKCPPEIQPKAETATDSPRPCASAIAMRLSPLVAMIAPAPTKKNMNVPAASARSTRAWSVMRRLFCTCGRLPPRRGEQGAHPHDPSRFRRHAGRRCQHGMGRDHRRFVERLRELATAAPARPLEARSREASRVGVGLHLGLAGIREGWRDLQNSFRFEGARGNASALRRSRSGSQARLRSRPDRCGEAHLEEGRLRATGRCFLFFFNQAGPPDLTPLSLPDAFRI